MTHEEVRSTGAEPARLISGRACAVTLGALGRQVRGQQHRGRPGDEGEVGEAGARELPSTGLGADVLRDSRTPAEDRMRAHFAMVEREATRAEEEHAIGGIEGDGLTFFAVNPPRVRRRPLTPMRVEVEQAH